MTFEQSGQPESPPEHGGSTSAGVKRAMNLALGHFIAKRLVLPRPLQAAELTAIRSAVEDHFEKATAGVTAVDVEGGWTAEESLEQHGLRVAMDMMVEGLTPPVEVPTTMTALHQTYSVVCDDNMDPEAGPLFVARFATADDAIRCLQDVVDGFLKEEYRPGMTADKLYDKYMTFGEDPWIKSPEGMPPVVFSAWDYAKRRCAEICDGDSA